MNSTRIFALGAFALLPGIAVSQGAGRPASAGAYSAEQVTRGQQQYTAHCASCHGEDMAGADVVPALTGSTFAGNWKGQTVSALATRIRTTMPLDNPGTLGTGAVADVSAYILSKNGYPAGTADLPREPSQLQLVKID